MPFAYAYNVAKNVTGMLKARNFLRTRLAAVGADYTTKAAPTHTYLFLMDPEVVYKCILGRRTRF